MPLPALVYCKMLGIGNLSDSPGKRERGSSFERRRHLIVEGRLRGCL